MKKKFIHGRMLKQLLLAVPASALMLGVSQAGTSVGINFQGDYYGYYTGAVVTATAFGLPATDWFSAPDETSGSMPVAPDSGGSLTVNWSCANTWGSGLYPTILFDGTNYTTPYPIPGQGQVLWGYLDDTSPGNTVSVSGLSSAFPNGYVVETVAAEVSSPVTFVDSVVSDGVTNEDLPYSNYWYPINFNPPFDNDGTAGLSTQSSVFTSDTITVSGGTRQGSARAPLCGFIITDQPVITQSPGSSTNNLGAPFKLTTAAIGIPPLSYQWQLDGTNLPGATFATYTNASATTADSGDYDVLVKNLYGSATSAVASVTILKGPSIVVDLPAALTNYEGMNASFSVVAGGAPPLTNTWFRDGTNLSVTTPSLTLTNLQTSDAGSYQVVVSDTYGSVTSSVANLTVLPSAPPYEGFAYANGDLAGESGGVGWNGAWSQETNGGSVINGGNAVFSPTTPWRGDISQLDSTGGAVELAAFGSADYDDIRSLRTTLGGNGYGTIYLSFVALVTNTTWGGIELVQDGNASLFLGSCWEGSDWGWGSRAAPDAASTVSPFTYSLLVYRFDYTPTNTFVRLYVNPAALSTEPSAASVSGTESRPITFDQIRIVTHGYLGTGAGPDGVLDEIRIGGTWASVTPHTIRTDAPFALQIVPGGVIQDTKPIGTPQPGMEHGASWLASSTDYNSVTRDGVEQFSVTNQGQITVTPDADFDTTNGTICFWMKYSAPITGFPGPGYEGAMLFDRRTTNGTVIVLNDSGAIEFQAAHGANYFVGNDDVADGNWHHVAITYDQSSNGVVSLYVDGLVDTSHPNTSAWSWPVTQEIELGRSHDPYWQIYDGQMDDFRIYNQILTSSEIATIATPATSDSLVDTNALMVRYNFDSGTYGQSVAWPYGMLQTSPALGPNAVWTTLTNAVSPQPFLATSPEAYFRLTGTP